ncbi:hypothetical protein [uncultured Bacteroides sp.]|nr:hypothetical protein [uncultured Bacteroides sp.]
MNRRERPEHPVRSFVPPRPDRSLPVERVERPLATPGAAVRIKSRRICRRIPWGLPERCPAFVRKTPRESDTKPRAIRHSSHGNAAKSIEKSGSLP